MGFGEGSSSENDGNRGEEGSNSSLEWLPEEPPASAEGVVALHGPLGRGLE